VKKNLRILIPFYFGLGNAVMFTPFLRTIKSIYPDCHIVLACGVGYKPEQIVPEELYDEIYYIPKFPYRFKRLICRLKGFDYYFYPFQGSNHIILILLKIFYRNTICIGHISKKRSKSIFDRLLLDKYENILLDLHESKKYLSLLKYIDIKKSDFIKEPCIKDFGYFSEKDYIVLQPSVSNNGDSPKKYPLEKWKETIRLIQDSTKMGIYLVGDKNEVNTLKNIRKINTERIKDLVGKTKIPELIRLLKSASLVIGCDSGITHISAALNTDTLVLWGPTDFINSHQMGNNVFFINKKLACAPCVSPFLSNERKAFKKCRTKRCMRSISPVEINEKISEILGRT